MKVTKIIIICVLCMLVSGAMMTAGYATWEEYKANTSTSEMGQQIVDEIDGTTKYIATTAERLWEYTRNPKEQFLKDIKEVMTETINIIKDFFKDAFKQLIPGYKDSDEGEGGNGFGGGGDGMGGGGGGAR